MTRLLFALLALAMLAACGGGKSSGFSTSPPSNTGGGTSPANPPVVVPVTAGTSAAGVDINVSAPQATPAPNATLLGATVRPAGGGTVSINLSNTGTQVHIGQTYVIALVGDGLTATMTPTISGPTDITVDLTSVKALNVNPGDKPGIAFTATISSGASLGARTVLLKNPQSDITSFTGGLEVIP